MESKEVQKAEESAGLEFSVRDMEEGDKNLIYSSWLKGLRHGNDWFTLIDSKSYYKTYHDIVEALLSEATVKIAHLKSDKDVILGYSVSSEKTLHWVFVKSLYRGKGVGKTLVPEGFDTVTHLTRLGVGYLKKHPDLIFDPFLIWKE